MLHTALLIAWIGCQPFDLGTTLVGLQRPGIQEGNRLMRGPHLVPVKIGVNLGFLLWPEARKSNAIPAMFATAGCAAGAWNLHVLRQK
jgi:hypothetical protein